MLHYNVGGTAHGTYTWCVSERNCNHLLYDFVYTKIESSRNKNNRREPLHHEFVHSGIDAIPSLTDIIKIKPITDLKHSLF